jgi:hypothetical protein
LSSTESILQSIKNSQFAPTMPITNLSSIQYANTNIPANTISTTPQFAASQLHGMSTDQLQSLLLQMYQSRVV